MSTPYPPQPRRLMRDPSNKLIGGVCSGVAKYLNMDVNLVRVLTVIISLFTGVPIVLYLIALFVLPEEGTQPPQPPYINGPQAGNFGAPAGYGQPWQQQTYGQQPPAPAPGPAPSPAAGPDPVWGAGGAPWEQPQTAAPSPEPQPWSGPATAAPEQPPAGAPTPEPVPETELAHPAPEQTSPWESAPAEPESADQKPADQEPEETKPQA